MNYSQSKVQKMQRRYKELPITKKIPLTISYCIEKSVERISVNVKELLKNGVAMVSNGCLLFCAAVPFVYVYQRDRDKIGDSILSSEG